MILECESYLIETALIAREHKMHILFHFITIKSYCTVYKIVLFNFIYFI